MDSIEGEPGLGGEPVALTTSAPAAGWWHIWVPTRADVVATDDSSGHRQVVTPVD